jgi:hypothetical protein
MGAMSQDFLLSINETKGRQSNSHHEEMLKISKFREIPETLTLNSGDTYQIPHENWCLPPVFKEEQGPISGGLYVSADLGGNEISKVTICDLRKP